ncbi:MAG: betaine--homocysteine S-methyltransferase [Anaerolineae bacterium]|nr:betaine--homocysteine S-methyltransferase [Anaerolineae bacterium]
MNTNIHELLSMKGPIIADGAMGTMLFQLGLEQGASPEMWNIDHPERIRQVHRQYIDAGSQIILTNTFGCNRKRLELHNLTDRVYDLNKAAARLARSVANGAEQLILVAGDIGPSGSVLEPYGDLPYDEAVEIFAEQAGGLLDGNIDVFWIETMSDLEELRAAVEGVRKVSSDVPVVTTMTFDTNGRTMMGVTPEQAVEAILKLDVAAFGGNCGNGPDEIEAVIGKMHAEAPDAVLIAKANAGIPTLKNGVAVYDATPADMAEYAKKVRDLGARIVGACCGSTPDHIQAIADAIKIIPT